MLAVHNALTPDDRALVRTLPMFAGLSREDFDHLTSVAYAGNLPAKAALFYEGDHAQDVFIVVSGWVKLYRITPDGEEAIINVFTHGQGIAEAVAFTNQRYPASGETISDARLVRIPAHSIISAIRANPDIAIAMLSSASVHLHRLVGEIARLKGLNGFARVVEFLTSLEREPGSLEIRLPFEKQTLARHLGMQPESLSRTFRRLKDYGIDVDNARVRLATTDALKRAAADM